MPGFYPASPERLALHEFTGIGERAAQMANLTADLLATVAAMSSLYYEDDAMNEIQPASFPKAIAASLDEWTFDIAAARDDWRAIAEDHQRQDREAREREESTLAQSLEALGYTFEHPGQYERTLENGARIGISASDGCGKPTESDWCACVYPPAWDGEQLAFDLRSHHGDGHGSLTFGAALAAATAAALAYSGESGQ